MHAISYESQRIDLEDITNMKYQKSNSKVYDTQIVALLNPLRTVVRRVVLLNTYDTPNFKAPIAHTSYEASKQV